MDNIESPALVYTAQEVADLLKINRDSVRLATVTGDLPHRQLGETTRSIRYTQADIDAFLEARSRRGGAAARRGEGEAAVVRMPAPRQRSQVPSGT